MSCKQALVKDVVLIKPDVTISDALKIIGDHEIRAVPVVDNDANYYGMFSIHSLMDDLLPVAARIAGGLSDLSFLEGGGPGAAKRIRKLAPMPVRAVIQRQGDESNLHPDLPLLETIRRLYEYGSPLPVLDQHNKFIGIVSEQSCLNFLMSMLADIEKEEQQQAG